MQYRLFVDKYRSYFINMSVYVCVSTWAEKVEKVKNVKSLYHIYKHRAALGVSRKLATLHKDFTPIAPRRPRDNACQMNGAERVTRISGAQGHNQA